MANRLYRLISSVGGLGYLPLAPGTWASAFAAAVWFMLARNNDGNYVLQLILVLVALIGGIYVSGKVANDEDKDPSHIVIDEVAGMWITLFLIPATWMNALAGFVLFRFFDIAKPFGIKRMENYRSGKGIMFDDALAGIYANILLRVILFSKLW